MNESGEVSIEVFRDGREIVFRFYGYSDAEVRAFAEDVEFMQGLMDECNEVGDFSLEGERRMIH